MSNENFNQDINQMSNMSKQSTPEFTKYLVLSIVQMMCCCQITGIIALVFTILSNSAFKIGNIEDYQSKIKAAKTTLIVGCIIGVIAYIIMIIVYMAIFGMALLSEL